VRINWSFEHAVVTVVCLAFVLFSSAYLVDYPAVYSDEPWVLSPVTALLRHGDLALPMFGEHYTTALYYTTYLASFLAVLGTDVHGARLVSLLHATGILVLVWLLARQLAPRSAWVAPVTLLFLYPFPTASRLVRPDVVVTFYGLLALVLYGAARVRRSPRWGFAAGLTAGFAVGIFLVGLWAAVVLAAWLAIDRRLRGVVVATVVGLVVGVLPLLVFAALTWSDYTRFSTKFGGSSIFAERHQDSGPLATAWDILSREPQRYEVLQTWSGSHLYALAVGALAVAILGTAAVRRDVRVLALAVLPVVLLAVSGDNKTPIYLLGPLTILATLVPYVLPHARLAVAAACVVGAAVIAVPFVRATHRDLKPLDVRFDEVARTYRSAFSFPQRSIVIGLPTLDAYWTDDPNVTFYSLHVLTRFDDFLLLDGEGARRKLARLAAGRPVFVVYGEASFFGELRQFEQGQDPPALPSLKRYVLRCFRTQALVPIRGSINGDYTERIARRVC
jgi:4-amino-4-deoxy-L-arabinose transferase-like glycosyltransferase